MRVLVIGASRGIGRETVSALRMAGHNPLGMSRGRAGSKAGGAKADEADATPWVTGDALDPLAVGHALSGVDAVILTLGIGNGDLFRPVSLFSEATKVVVAAMRQDGPKRLIVVTGFGAGRSRAAIPFWQKLPFDALFGRAYSDKDIQEALVMDSGLDWTIVRPGVLTNGARTDRYLVLSHPSSWRNGMVSRKDVAAFLAQQVADKALIGHDVVIVD